MSVFISIINSSFFNGGSVNAGIYSQSSLYNKNIDINGIGHWRYRVPLLAIA